MTFAEFRNWASTRLAFEFPYNEAPIWRMVWGSGDSFNRSRAGTGSGFDAVYGEVQQRRLAFWLRAQDLISHLEIARWIDAAETRDTGWLINCGDGIWWTEDPSIVARDLVQTGFIAVRCGVDG